MQTGYSGSIRPRLVTSSTGKSAVRGVGALARHQFGTSQALHKRLQPQGVRTGKQRSSRLNVSALTDGPLPVVLDKDFDKEGSRVYKRTVFNFGNWAAHRSTRRYGRHIYTILGSRIFRGLLGPLLAVTTLATSVATYETLREMGSILPANAPALSAATNAPLGLTSFALSLLLVFRTNTSYARWAEARDIWGGVTNRSRDILRQALTFVPEGKPELVDMLMRWSIAYSKVLMCHLREDGDVQMELQGILPPEELSALVASKHRPNFVLGMLSELVACLHLPRPERFRMDANITFFHDCHGKCERILKTPIPLSYTRHTSRFLVIWLSIMPFTLWKSCHWSMVPAAFIICFLLLSIEEIGVQIEEPFGILPLEAMAASIETNLRDMADINGDVRRKVLSVSKECIAQTGNRYQWNGTGNGNGSGGGNGNEAMQPEPEHANQQAESGRDALKEPSSSAAPKKRGVFAQSFFNFFRPAASNP